MTDDVRDKLVNYRLKTARALLKEEDDLIALNYWNTATNRLYYASYTAISALLIKNGITASSHKGVRIMFSQHFIKTGLISKYLGVAFNELFNNRHSGDYSDFFDNTQESVMDLYPFADRLLLRIEEIINNPT